MKCFICYLLKIVIAEMFHRLSTEDSNQWNVSSAITEDSNQWNVSSAIYWHGGYRHISCPSLWNNAFRFLSLPFQFFLTFGTGVSYRHISCPSWWNNVSRGNTGGVVPRAGGVVSQRWTRFIASWDELWSGKVNYICKHWLPPNVKHETGPKLIINGWGCHRISLFIHCRLNLTMWPLHFDFAR